MSGLFNQASLVLVPSGYKSGKVYSQVPTSGDGDLTFTRASDATRVNSDGLIEKVRTNLLLYSEEFDNASWGKNGATVTANATTSPDGNTTADKIVENTSNAVHWIFQSITGTYTTLTISCYMKKGERDWGFIRTRQTTNDKFAYFNLNTGVVGTVESGITASITNVGDGWYRCVVVNPNPTTSANPSVIGLSNADNVSTYTGDGTSGIFIWGAQLETGDIATEYIPTTTTAVSVGMTANVPRLDYSQGSCPALLLEPQRTNLALYSEQFDNAYWDKADVTISANATTSPDGYTNADKFIPNTVNNIHAIRKTGFASNAYTFSVFAKADGETQFSMWLLSNSVRALFDLSNGTILSSTVTSSKIEDYGNGWYRCSVYSSTAGTTASIYGRTGSAFIGNDSDGIFFYGAQLEEGAYATSYIPTTSATVTRLADSCSKTGISSLIGQTEGTLFVEVDTAVLGDVFAGVNRRFLSISDGTTDNRIFIYQDRTTDAIGVVAITSNTLVADITTVSNQSGIKKIAVGYANNDFVMYINGVQIGTDTIGSVPACSRVGVGSFETSANTANAACPVSQVLLFKTRLTNSELQSLTTL